MSNSHQNIFENWRVYVSDILSEGKRTEALKDILKKASRIAGREVTDPKAAQRILLKDRMAKIQQRKAAKAAAEKAAKEKAAKAAAGDATQATPTPDVDTPNTFGDTQVVNPVDPKTSKTQAMGSADPKTGKTQPMGSKTGGDTTVKTNRPVPDPDATTVSVKIPDEIADAANKIESPDFIDKGKLPEIINDLVNGANPQRVASDPELLDIYKQLLRDQSELRRLATAGAPAGKVAVVRVKMARRIRNIASQLDAGDVAEAKRVQALLDINSYGALEPNHAINKLISDGGYAVRFIQRNKGKALSSIAVLALAAAYINTADDGIPDTLAAQDPDALQKLKDTLGGIEDVDPEGSDASDMECQRMRHLIMTFAFNSGSDLVTLAKDVNSAGIEIEKRLKDDFEGGKFAKYKNMTDGEFRKHLEDDTETRDNPLLTPFEDGTGTGTPEQIQRINDRKIKVLTNAGTYLNCPELAKELIARIKGETGETGETGDDSFAKASRIAQDSGKDLDEVSLDLEERKVDALADVLITGNMRFKISDFPTRVLRLFVASIVDELEIYLKSRNANVTNFPDGTSLDLRVTDPRERKQAILDYMGIRQEDLKTMRLRGTALSLKENKDSFDPTGDARALYIESILTFMENIIDGGFDVDPRWKRFSDTDQKLGKTMSEKEKTYFKRKFYNALRFYLSRAYEILTTSQTVYNRMDKLKKSGKLDRIKYLEKYDEE